VQKRPKNLVKINKFDNAYKQNKRTKIHVTSLGKKWFAFNKMKLVAYVLLDNLLKQ
jgi:hypothetical protein